jgi:hypothetical protein
MSQARRSIRRATALALAAGSVVGVAALGGRVGRADAPAGRYTTSSGVVTDTKTGLSWTQNVAVGADAGPMELNEPDALAYCNALTTAGLKWRLPSVGELHSIIDETRYDPALDTTAFPNAPYSDFYWSQSAYENFAGVGWGVSFEYGITTVKTQGESGMTGITDGGGAGQSGWVRCVRP